jgi:hypothetical protein
MNETTPSVGAYPVLDFTRSQHMMSAIDTSATVPATKATYASTLTFYKSSSCDKTDESLTSVVGEERIVTSPDARSLAEKTIPHVK